jgi:hypothetical protein
MAANISGERRRVDRRAECISSEMTFAAAATVDMVITTSLDNGSLFLPMLPGEAESNRQSYP